VSLLELGEKTNLKIVGRAVIQEVGGLEYGSLLELL
jgi:hypothetical protein